MIITVTVNPAIDVVTATQHVVPSGKLRCDAARQGPGGGGINVSRTIEALGGTSTAVFTSGGLTGARLSALLGASPTIAHAAIPVRGETRENLLVEEKAGGREWHFVLPGPELAELEWRAVLHAVQTADPAPDLIVASGSLPAGVPEDFFAQLADVARARSARVILDTRGEPMLRALDRGVWMIKPNVGELAELTGEDLRDERGLASAAQRLVAAGACEVVVLSLGRGGAVLVTRDDSPLHLRSPVVRQISRVGAGDGMVGGMVLALDQGRSLHDAVRAGVVAGAATVMRPPFEVCRRDDVEDLAAALQPEGAPS